MAYLEELLPEFRKGAKIRRRKWIPNSYIYKDGSSGFCFTDEKEQYNFTHEDIVLGEWELYQEPEPDWDYIIENKYLCWFWDDDTDIHLLGTLNKISDLEDQFGDFKYKWNINSKYWKNCRPVCKDEVTFYEDMTDEEA